MLAIVCNQSIFNFALQLFSKGGADMAKDGDIVCDIFTWGLSGAFSLYDDKGVVSCLLY